MRARWRHQGGEALDSLQRREQQIGLFAAALWFGTAVDQLRAQLAQRSRANGGRAQKSNSRSRPMRVFAWVKTPACTEKPLNR